MIRSDGLRPHVDTVEREVARVEARADAADTVALRAAWRKLVEFLALGPAPQLANCPHCGAVGMRDATRCGTCWLRIDAPERA